MISRLLVANRGEIARRIVHTCRRLGIETVAVHSEADAGLPYVREADVVVPLPGNAPAETYLRTDLLVDSARRAGADAVHPGYGFLAENADFARDVIDAGLTWIGPTPASIEQMGSKIKALEIMGSAGVPVLPSIDASAYAAHPELVEGPLLVKASAGGGGRGMRIVRDATRLEAELAAARAEAESAFGDGTVYVEPYVEGGRHVEVQVVGDGAGSILVLGERDCSVQRRHQKVIEEAPAPGLSADTRDALHAAARLAAAAIDYRGAGTVEFLYEPAGDRFFFLEMNTRLQVEHAVTEEVLGVDLVELQIAVAEGRDLAIPDEGGGSGRHSRPEGHAIEVRLYAEDPAAGFAPQAGLLTAFDVPGVTAEFARSGGLRLDSGVVAGDEIGTFYDAMLAKLVAWAPTREQAARRLAATLAAARIHGVPTNRDLLVAILRSDTFLTGRMHTTWLDTAGVVEELTATDRDGVRSAAIAATLVLAERTRRRGFPVAWRNVPSRPQRTEFATADGDAVTVEWYGTRTGDEVEGATVVAVRPTEATIEVDGVRTTYAVAISGPPGCETVDVDGPHGHTALRRIPRFVDPATRVAAGSLLAPMPGSVVAVHAAVGDVVAAGQPLLVMEAMKMQHTVTAPTAGTVTELAASVGQQVEAGSVLAVVSTGSTTDDGSTTDEGSTIDDQITGKDAE